MAEKKTHVMFLEEFFNKYTHEEYEVLSEYINAKEKIVIQHTTCNREFSSLPYNILKGKGCPHCNQEARASKSRKTHEEFIEEVFGLVGDEYTVLGKYTTAKTHIEIKHNVCGVVNRIMAGSFVGNGGRCPTCSGNKKLSQKDFEERVFVMGEGEYNVIGKYVNADTKVELFHTICENIYLVVPYHFFSGVRCSYCGGFNVSHDDFLERVYDLVKDEYVVIGQYINAYTKVRLKHKHCDHIWDVEPKSFVSNGSRCPSCSSSNGEKKIKEWLDVNVFSYNRQYRFEDCRNVLPLPFDFAVFKNSNLVCLIEFDGEQHYRPVEWFGGEETFKATQQRDSIKNTYCLEKGIPLLRIPFYDFNHIEDILNTYFQYKVAKKVIA